MERVAEGVAAAYDDVTTLDGAHVNVGDGWFLIRASGTQSLVRVTAEACDENRCAELFATAYEFVEE